MPGQCIQFAGARWYLKEWYAYLPCACHLVVTTSACNAPYEFVLTRVQHIQIQRNTANTIGELWQRGAVTATFYLWMILYHGVSNHATIILLFHIKLSCVCHQRPPDHGQERVCVRGIIAVSLLPGETSASLGIRCEVPCILLLVYTQGTFDGPRLSLSFVYSEFNGVFPFASCLWDRNQMDPTHSYRSSAHDSHRTDIFALFVHRGFRP